MSYDDHIEAYEHFGVIPVALKNYEPDVIRLLNCPWCGVEFWVERRQEQKVFHCPECCMEVMVE